MTIRKFVSAFVLLILTSCPHALLASDHLDAPLVFKDGRLDVNDSYIFQSPTNPDRTVMIMTVNPVAGIMSPSTFNSAAVYEFNIDRDGDAIAAARIFHRPASLIRRPLN